MGEAKRTFFYTPSHLQLHHLILLLFMLSSPSSLEVCFARFVVEKNSINILAPESIAGKHDSAIGNFGAPDYGGSMILDVQTLSSSSKGSDSDGCKPFEPEAFKRTGPKSNPTVALLDRGGLFSFSSPSILNSFVCIFSEQV